MTEITLGTSIKSVMFLLTSVHSGTRLEKEGGLLTLLPNNQLGDPTDRSSWTWYSASLRAVVLVHGQNHTIGRQRII